MKPLLLVSAITLILLASCVKENTPLTPPVNPNPVDTMIAGLRYSGEFQNGPFGTVRGYARVYQQNNQYFLLLDSFSSSNGPDLYVYLSKEVQPVNYISLGRLQAVTGNQEYAISGSPEFSQYKYALIHCQRFNHLFGVAELR